MDINSDDLKTFVTVVDSGTLGAAATNLGQTTSAVSRALSRLEEKLATSLLTRTTRRMELTDEGHLLLKKARSILAAMDEAEEAIRVRRQRPSGRLRIDAAAPFILHAIVPHVAEFRALYPEITLELTSNDQVADLLEHRTDIAIRIGTLQDSTLHARALNSNPLYYWRVLNTWKSMARRKRRKNWRSISCWDFCNLKRGTRGRYDIVVAKP